MTCTLRILAALTLAVSAAAFGQAPNAQTGAQAPAQSPAPSASTSPAPHQHPPMSPPSNLQVLPKDMTSEQVHSIMHQWSGDLGVRCNYCHASDAATGRLNFASDANPMKARARVMAKMTHTINADYLTQLDPMPEHDVNCGTCHRGMAKPAVFTPPTEEKH